MYVNLFILNESLNKSVPDTWKSYEEKTGSILTADVVALPRIGEQIEIPKTKYNRDNICGIVDNIRYKFIESGSTAIFSQTEIDIFVRLLDEK